MSLKDYKEVFGSLISDAEWSKILEIANQFNGFTHPIMYLLDNDIICSNKHNICSYQNTKRAICSIKTDNKWLQRKVKNNFMGSNLQNISSALGEIRCYGYLLDIFGYNNVKAIKEGNKQKPDFKVKGEDFSVHVEVITPQISDDQVEKFNSSSEKYNPANIFTHITCFKKEGISYIDSIYRKLTNAKKSSSQLKDLQTPTILWIDLQDSYIDSITDRIFKNGPYYSAPTGYIMTNELWYSAYAEENMPFFDYVTLHSGEGRKHKLSKTKFGGRFSNLSNNFISAIVYYAPNGLLIYENPNALNKLPDSFIKYFSKGTYFKLENSRINFPNNDLKEKIELERKSVNELGKNDFYKF